LEAEGHATSRGFSFPYGAPSVALAKSGKAEDVLAAARNQHFALHHLDKLPAEARKNLRIPAIYHVIEHHPRAYAITEYTDGEAFASLAPNASDEVANRMRGQISRAIATLKSFPLPPDMPVGPIGGGKMLAGPFGHNLDAYASGFRGGTYEDLRGFINNVSVYRSLPTQ
jgi:hypothetical protein